MGWKDWFRGKDRQDQAGETPPATMLRESPRPGWILQPGQLLVGNYRIEGMIGSPGGMGQVFKAHDAGLGRTVAVKVPALNILVDPDGPERFLREARTAERLGPHPHIVQIKSCLTDPNLWIAVADSRRQITVPFFVMEYLGGGDLADLLKKGPLDLNVASALFSNICSALQCAHSFVYREGDITIRGVVHRDLKPENVCFDETGRLVVVDFGIAKLLSELSSTRGTAGTPSYMAPEQWNPVQGIDHRTDVYAAGVVLFQMLTGRLPFTGLTEEVMAAHLMTPPPDPREWRADLPESIVSAIRKALAKEKEKRFASAQEFAGAVKLGLKGVATADSSTKQDTAASKSRSQLRGTKADRARWSRLAPFPRKLTDYGAVWDGEGSRLHVFGGVSATSVSDELWQFDRASNSWDPIPSGNGPAGRTDASTVWDAQRRRMYVFGGSGNDENFHDLWSYSPDENHWEELESLNPPPPTSAYLSQACWDAEGDRMLVCCHDGQVWSYAPGTSTWELLSAGGAPANLHTSGVAWDLEASRIYIFGGWDKPMDVVARSDLWAFNMRGSRWEKLDCGTSLPPPRIWPGAVCDRSGCLFIFGGASGNIVVRWDDFWVYKPTNSSWQRCQTTGRGPRARFKPRLLFDDPTRTLFVLGGADQYALNDFWACRLPEPH